MKSGRLWWGLLFLALGIFILLSNLGIFTLNWSMLASWWPLLLIFWGISVLTQNPGARFLFVAITALVLAAVIMAGIQYNWFDETSGSVVTEELSEPLSEAVTKAKLELDLGAGQFIIDGTTSKLVQVKAATNMGDYRLTKQQEGDEAQIRLEFDSLRHVWRGGGFKNRVDIALSDKPVWEIDVDGGAAEMDFDLTKYNVSKLDIKTGATSLSVKMGDKAVESQVKIDAGASSLELDLPESVGVQVKTRTGLTSRDLGNMTKIDDNTYETTGFKAASKKIYLEVDAGVSSLSITQY